MIFPKVFRWPALVCILLATILLPAQTRKSSPKELPESAFKLIEVKVTGTLRYKPEDIVVATGLQIGQTVHEDDFKDAARFLSDTGVFGAVAYTFQYAPNGTKLEFQVEDATQFVPARFENMVWFSNQELRDKLRALVPLFQGELPATGELTNHVSEALQALLIEAKVAGRADYIRVASLDGPVEAISFSVSGPRIIIRDVEFSGVDASLLPGLQNAAKTLKDQEYSQTAVRQAADKRFLLVCLAQGYLKAAFDGPEAKVVESDEHETTVDVSFSAALGPQYRLASLEISGNRAFPTDTLRQMIHTQINQPANAVQLENDLQSIQKFYGTRGFMAASIKAERQRDDAEHLVKWPITIVEGDIYKMGELEIHGLDSDTTARMQSDWTLRPDEVYDSSYPQQFVEQASKKLSAQGEWDIIVHESVDPVDKTVDVTMRFVRKF